MNNSCSSLCFPTVKSLGFKQGQPCYVSMFLYSASCIWFATLYQHNASYSLQVAVFHQICHAVLAWHPSNIKNISVTWFRVKSFCCLFLIFFLSSCAVIAALKHGVEQKRTQYKVNKISEGTIAEVCKNKKNKTKTLSERLQLLWQETQHTHTQLGLYVLPPQQSLSLRERGLCCFCASTHNQLLLLSFLSAFQPQTELH